jgi:hypothetical protein
MRSCFMRRMRMVCACSARKVNGLIVSPCTGHAHYCKVNDVAQKNQREPRTARLHIMVKPSELEAYKAGAGAMGFDELSDFVRATLKKELARIRAAGHKV